MRPLNSVEGMNNVQSMNNIPSTGVRSDSAQVAGGGQTCYRANGDIEDPHQTREAVAKSKGWEFST
jgi:hypothetical protein